MAPPLSLQERLNLAPPPVKNPPHEMKARLDALRVQWGALEGEQLLEAMINQAFPNEIAVSSSFGSESVVLLDMISRINPHVPVLFLNTGKLFPETLRYRDLLQERLGLTDLRAIGPDAATRREKDPDGSLWNRDPDACCYFRKTVPLERAMMPFSAMITGRKRFQTAARAGIPSIELAARRLQSGHYFVINPLITWTQKDLEAYIEAHHLPIHPLRRDGYLSIGCMPCTERTGEGGDYRSGRWAGQDKEECGIHAPGMDGDGI